LTALACNIIFKSLSGIHAPVTASLVISGLTGLFIFFLSLRAINGLPAELIRKPAKGNVTE